MSAGARHYVYEVEVKDRTKKPPQMSAKTLQQCKENVAKYLAKKK